MTFEAALKAAGPPAADHFKPGLQALGGYANRIMCSEPRRFRGSVDLDSAFRHTQPHANRWDFGLGFSENGGESAIWIEVHPATTSEVKTVLEKLSRLQEWLNRDAPHLRKITTRKSGARNYFRIATAGVHINRSSPQFRRLSEAGLDTPRRILDLP